MNATHPLSALIQSVEAGRGWTDREVARRIEVAGHAMSHSYIGKLKNHPIQTVTASMIQALAAGLGIDEAVVAQAAVESMGVRIQSEGEGLDVAIARESALTDYDRRLLRSLVREMRDDHKTIKPTTPPPDDPRVADRLVADGATPTKGDYTLAGHTGHSKLERLDAEADRRGEESQDPEDWA